MMALQITYLSGIPLTTIPWTFGFVLQKALSIIRYPYLLKVILLINPALSTLSLLLKL